MQINSTLSVVPQVNDILSPLVRMSDVHVNDEGNSKKASMWRTKMTK